MKTVKTKLKMPDGTYIRQPLQKKRNHKRRGLAQWQTDLRQAIRLMVLSGYIA